MISIQAIDPSLKLPIKSTPDIEISQKSEYLRGYHRIACAVHAGENLNVLVYDKTVARWLRIMARKYGAEEITFTEITPRTLLKNQMGYFELPEDLMISKFLIHNSLS